MLLVKWHSEAVDDLIEHDGWRVANRWEPIAEEIMDAVAALFADGAILPKQTCRIWGEISPVYRTWVEVRSKRFFVYFMEDESKSVIRRILHPKRDRSAVEE
jgi:hypothetical protein